MTADPYWDFQTTRASGGLAAALTTPTARCVVTPYDRIVYLGDSLIEGLPQTGYAWQSGVTKEPGPDTMVAPLVRMIKARFRLHAQQPLHILAGVGGSNVQGTRDDRQHRVIDYAPTLVFSNLGINDCRTTAGNSETSDSSFTTNYQTIITDTRASYPSCRFVLFSPICRGEKRDGTNADDAAIERKRGLVSTLVSNNARSWYVDLRGVWQTYVDAFNQANAAQTGLTYDGTHPVFAGARLYSQAIYDSLDFAA